MAALWIIVGKVANLVQLFGLDFVTLILMAMSFLRFHEVQKECRKLEGRVQRLMVLLPSPAGSGIMQQQHLELGHLVTNALRDAHDLVKSYNGSTLFVRVRRGRSLARQFRELRNSIESYCCPILSVSACLLIVEAYPPPSLVIRARTEFNDGDLPPSAGYSIIDAETYTAAPDDTHVINVSLE
ncbi:unnamed protein product [Urochloa decumbens]|uniref:Uncharacterized protein n=1 Tax=Urochloa decumbens TaxID=240449 RepID=A0ABC9AZF1_9POAL